MFSGDTSRNISEGGYGNAGEHPERLRSGEERGVSPISSNYGHSHPQGGGSASGNNVDACAPAQERSSLVSLPPKAKNSRPKGGIASEREADASAKSERVYPEGIVAPEKVKTRPSPPYLLGGVNSQKGKLPLKQYDGAVGIDWLQGTIPVEYSAFVYDYISKMCGTDPEIFDWGRFCYQRHCVWHPFGIKMFWDTDPDKSEMHRGRFTIQLTGQSLQDFHADSLFKFIRDLAFLFEFKATRLDLCFDDYRKIKMPHELIEIAEQGNFTGFKRWKPEQERRISGEYISDGMYFGSRGKNGSGRFLRCYDKNLESLGEIDSVRWEVEFSKQKANLAFRKIIEMRDLETFGGMIGALIGGSINFVNRKGKNLERMEILDWWQVIQNILGNVKLRNPKRIKSIEKTVSWLETSVSASLKKVHMAMGEENFEDLIDEMLKTAQLRKYQTAQVKYYWNKKDNCRNRVT
jgi:hypothetical protein